jgi:hypothetical protein
MVESKTKHVTAEKINVKGRMKTSIYLTFLWMLPVVVCNGWVVNVARKTCCVWRNSRWCGRGAARKLSMEMNRNMAKNWLTS